jgi:hypothetical protein
VCQAGVFTQDASGLASGRCRGQGGLQNLSFLCQKLAHKYICRSRPGVACALARARQTGDVS